MPGLINTIWFGLRDAKLNVREQACVSLRACLMVVEKRETRYIPPAPVGQSLTPGGAIFRLGLEVWVRVTVTVTLTQTNSTRTQPLNAWFSEGHARFKLG